MFTILTSGYHVSNYVSESKIRYPKGYEFEMCTTDNSTSLFDDQPYNRIIGSFFVGKPGQKRQTINNFESYYIHVTCEDSEFCEKYLDTLPIQIFNVDTYKFTQYLKEIHFIHRKQVTEFTESNKLLLEAKITAMVLELYQIAQSQEVSNEISKYVSNIATACQYISEHFHEPISIEEIAQAAMLSTSFTYVIFKKVTGMTPHAFLKNTRIHYACEQLVYTSKNIAQISIECGFSSEYYLNQIFAKHTGMTPGQYRRHYQKKLE